MPQSLHLNSNSASSKKIFWILFCLAVSSRVLMPILFPGNSYNFAPAGALALFAGAGLASSSDNKRDKRLALILPILSIFAGDFLISLASAGSIPLFYPGFYFQYLAYALIALLGSGIAKRLSFSSVLAGSLGSTLIFFTVSNFGVWAVTGLYPQTATGLLNCFLMALPFLKNTLLSDLLFNVLMFGSLLFSGLKASAKLELATAKPTASDL